MSAQEASRAGDPTAGRQPLVFSVVVNYRGATDTIACVTSLLESAYPAQQVVVVDNASGDDVAAIRGRFGDRIEVVAAPRNLGYGGAANLGIEHAMAGGASYVWVLNNDTVIQRETLTELVGAMEAGPSLGAVSPVIEAPVGPESPAGVWFAGGTLRLSRAEAVHSLARPEPRSGTLATQFLSGCAMLLRCDALGGAAPFWERLFLYWEDVDVSLRLRAAGWGLGVVPAAIMTHFPHATVPSSRAIVHSFRNAILVTRRDSSTADVTGAIGSLCVRLARAWGSALLRRRPAPISETRAFGGGVELALLWTLRMPAELQAGIKPRESGRPDR